MPLRNERAYEVINKDYFPNNFKVSLMDTGMVTPDSCCLHSCFFHYENKANDTKNCSHCELIPLVNKRLNFSVVDDVMYRPLNGVTYGTEFLSQIII